MRLCNVRTHGFSLSVLLIVVSAFLVSATMPVMAQPLLEQEEQEILSEDRVVEIVQSFVFNGRKVETVRQDLRKLAELKLNQMETFCNLTSEQRRKLEFAAAGDATRFLHEVSNLGRELGRQFQGRELGKGEIVSLIQACSSLDSRLRGGLYRKDSLYEKVRDSILSEEQIQKFQTAFDVAPIARVRATGTIIPLNRFRLIDE